MPGQEARANLGLVRKSVAVGTWVAKRSRRKQVGCRSISAFLWMTYGKALGKRHGTESFPLHGSMSTTMGIPFTRLKQYVVMSYELAARTSHATSRLT